MYEKILVPLDGSKTAEMVIPYAEEIAAKLGSKMLAKASQYGSLLAKALTGKITRY